MSYGTYMSKRIWELLLTFISALSMSMVGFNAFFLRDMPELTQLVIAAPVVAALLVALFTAAWDRKHLPLGIGLSVVLCFGVLAVAMSLSTGEDPWADAEGNYLYFAAVIIACSVACFCLTRTIAGGFTWVAVCTVLCAVVQGMYQMGEYLFSFAACAAALTMVAYRSASRGTLDVDVSTGSSSFRRFANSLLPVASALAAAVIVWFAVIAPLNPGTCDIKLITEYRRLPIVMLKGTADVIPQINKDLTTTQLQDGENYTTDDLKIDKKSDVTVPARSKSIAAQQLSQSQGQSSAGGASGSHEKATNNLQEPEQTPQSYSSQFPWIIIFIIAALLLAVALFLFLRWWRKRRQERLRRLLAGTPKEQLSKTYLWLQGRMARLGFKVPPGQTLAEWARGNARSMDVFTEETGVSFETLTGAYVECCAYGTREPMEDEIVQASAFYMGFWKGARSYLGRVRYFFKSFRL